MSVVHHPIRQLYGEGIDVPISQLRSNLRAWVDRARAGDDVVITERGVPVARLVAVDAAGLIERLERDGVITRPKRSDRPRATGRARVPATAAVADLVTDLRRQR